MVAGVSGELTTALATLAPLDAKAVAAATARQGRLVKPPGALGQLETLSIQLAGIAGQCPPPVPAHPAVALFAGDHGVVAAGVTPWPQEVTAQMVAAACHGGAAVSVLCRQFGARLVIVDVGVASALTAHPLLLDRKIGAGTADLSRGPAMHRDDVDAALDVGAAVAALLVAEGADLLVTGEMGIGNTTAAAAVIAAITGARAEACTGRGTGINDTMLAHKTAIVAAAAQRARAHAAVGDARAILADVGGFEIAALAGFVIGGAAAGVPVVLDGVITLAAALAAEQLAPGVVARVIAGHRSVEPGASLALSALGLDPVIDLGLRLGEASGGCLAVPIVQAAAATLGSMATFDAAAVTTIG